jgi:integrase/recombinase XerC
VPDSSPAETFVRCIHVSRPPAAPREWAEAITTWLVSLQAAGRPETTLRLRRYQLGRVAEGVAPLGPWQATGDALVAWLGAQTWSAETRRSWRSAIRSFYGWAVETGRCARDPSRALPAVKPTQPNPRPAPEGAYRIALAGADQRVRLMIRLAADLGLRRGEVARVSTADLERERDGWYLLVHGKGGKLRRLPVDDALAAAIRRAGPGFVFPGRVAGHLSAHWVGKLVARQLPAAWAMHSLRHRFGTVAYEYEHDLVTVQQLLGHASPVTTIRYVLRPAAAMRRTVAAVAAL